jgi:hypothetical protein
MGEYLLRAPRASRITRKLKIDAMLVSLRQRTGSAALLELRTDGMYNEL